MTDVNLYVMVGGALLGAIKSATEFGKHKGLLLIVVDVAIGTFCGVSLAKHFHNTGSLPLSALLSIVGGSCGAVVIEVLMQMVPNMAKTFIKKWFSKL